jgi:hypothetical protein
VWRKRGSIHIEKKKNLIYRKNANPQSEKYLKNKLSLFNLIWFSMGVVQTVSVGRKLEEKSFKLI